ncbi:MAG TPA: gfo/Idh/MocA family oxidoreductase, partial [Devosia sp.]|nr:gfo/Idh/MocA family oxidoreductase [Devosia sp.]
MYRAVLAGCGNMAKGWLRALNEAPELRGRVELVGLVDINPAAAEALRQEFALTGAKTGGDLEQMLAQT